jgi:ankyrin repeat protein
MLSNYHQAKLYQYFRDNDLKKIKSLLNKGLDINFIDKTGECLLSYAILANNIKAIEFLVEKNVVVPEYGTKVREGHIPYLKLYFKMDTQALLLDTLLNHYPLNVVIENKCYEFDNRFDNEAMQKMNTTFLGRLLFNGNIQLMKVVIKHLNVEEKETIYPSLIYLAEHYFDFKMNNNKKPFFDSYIDTLNVILDDVIDSNIKVDFIPTNTKFLHYENMNQRFETISLLQNTKAKIVVKSQKLKI